MPLPGDALWGFFIGCYAVVLSNAFFFAARRCVAHGAVEAACECHDRLLHGVLRAPLSFFDSNPSGRVVNRFGPDLLEIEQMLPWWMSTPTSARRVSQCWSWRAQLSCCGCSS